MMKSALLFYKKLVAELREMGFAMNLYNPCIANKNGEWNADDNQMAC
jgi:hypothetical protein